jgi:ferric-dicitrate binding protein FerR (iron transport regulator)
MQKLINYKRIDELILDYLTQDLEADDLNELQIWINLSEENRKYFLQKQEIWFSTIITGNSQKFDYQNAYNRFLVNISPKLKKSKTKRLFKLRSLSRIAASVILLIGLGVGLYWFGSQHLIGGLSDSVVESPFGSRTKLYLPDGTMVWLNAGSKLSYSSQFGTSNRNVSLEGEGYFEVTKNKKLPFAVKTKELLVKVLGTKFNFRNFSDDKEAIVTLLEGKVSLNNELGKKKFFLIPNQQAILNKKTGITLISTVKAFNSFEWTKGILRFDEEKLCNITHKLERVYNIKITIADSSLCNYHFYGNFEQTNKGIKDILDVLASTGKLTYTKEGEEIILSAVK